MGQVGIWIFGLDLLYVVYVYSNMRSRDKTNFTVRKKKKNTYHRRIDQEDEIVYIGHLIEKMDILCFYIGCGSCVWLT